MQMGIFRVVKRTEGISTTQIIDNLIAMSISIEKDKEEKLKATAMKKSFSMWKRRGKLKSSVDGRCDAEDKPMDTSGDVCSTSSAKTDTILFSTLAEMYSYHHRQHRDCEAHTSGPSVDRQRNAGTHTYTITYAECARLWTCCKHRGRCT